MPLPRLISVRPLATGLLIGALTLTTPVATAAQSIAGAFLAAREAGVHNDFANAIPYLERMLEATPDDLGTLEGAAVSAFSTGDYARAAGHAARLAALDPENRAAALILMAEAFATEDYATALEVTEGDARIHPLLDDLARAWAHMGEGRMSEALDLLDEVSNQDGMTAFALYCRALALSLVGDIEGALEILEDPEDEVAQTLNRRGYIAYAQLLGLSERYEDALALIGAVFAGSSDPVVAQMRTAFEEGRALPFDLITTPAQGLAEVLAVMASALRTAQNPHEALIYAQSAVRVNPGLSDAQLMIGQIFEELGQPELAVAAYARIPRDDGFSMAARMGQAQVLEGLGELDAAVDELAQLVAENPQSYVAAQVLGDFQRRNDQYQEAVASYTLSFELMQARGIPPNWQSWFSRAVAYERLGQWPEAEADFRAALAIEPNQSTVLNYLGYSLVERGELLDEALEMIERAVRAEPDSGYITDSLAWALFRLGRYAEAVPPMERSVELEPTDPILNDHLGDVYWAVGRQREARFQWRRALSFGPHEDMDDALIYRKLEVGLDAVRAERGEPPLQANPAPAE